MTKNELISWLRKRVAESLYLDPDEIKMDEPLEQYGLGSKENVMISGDLEELLERDLPHTILWDYPTVESLCSYLMGEEAEERVESHVRQEDEPIAVIGIGCRFPGASSPERFWKLMMNRENHISTVPPKRWPKAQSQQWKNSPAQYGGFLPHVDQFDSAFFGISPKEAELMNPAQRLLLEVTWESLEDAGLTMEQLKGSDTAVFMGVSGNDYLSLMEKETDFYYLTGNSSSILANRISYFMDWYGPSMTLDTACSSSLVAVDLASQHIRSGRCSLAFVGGVNLLLTPSNSIRFASGNVLASDGRCKTFDASADGYVRGEGAGVVVLKPLSQAQADNDRIYAIIHGTSVNQDGKSNGLTAPNIHAQKALLKSAVKSAGIQPQDIFYVEAHGTGTPLGDPIEVNALAEVYAAQQRKHPLHLGSVKTNIGHLEAAAGITGLIKSVLSAYHKQIPPNLHFKQWNPQIPADKFNLQVVTEPIEIPEGTYIGVNSFGFGGTNSHVIVGKPPSPRPISSNLRSSDYACTLLPLSAKSDKSLQKQITKYKNFIAHHSSDSLSSVAANIWNKRDHHDHRVMILAKDSEEAVDLLTLLETNQSHERVFRSGHIKADQVVFVFSGQGPKWSISQELLEKNTVFLNTLLEMEQALQHKISWSIVEKIAKLKTESDLSMVETQILYFAVQVALARLWMSWGVNPSAVVGHSLGEIAAAHIAGALSLSDALDVVIERSRAAQKMENKGKLLVLQADKKTAEDLCEQANNRIAIGVFNSPVSHVLSGDNLILERIQSQLEQRGIFAKFVATSPYPSHSFYMHEIRKELVSSLRNIQPNDTFIPFVSTVSGKKTDGSSLHADYWCDNICQPVQFQQAISNLMQDQKKWFLEISPHPVLEIPIYESASALPTEVKFLPSLERDQPNDITLLSSLARLYCNGLVFDWTKVVPEATSRLFLPKYPWDHKRYWVDSSLKQVPSDEKEDRQRVVRSTNIEEYVLSLLSETLKIPVEDLEQNKPLIHMGLDSIMALRLKSSIEKKWAVQISIVPIMQGCTIKELLTMLPKKRS